MPEERAVRSLFSFLVGKLRRSWLTTFRPGYVRAQRARRRGSCRQCGRCCRLGFRCPLLTRRNRCAIYHVVRPANCTRFPIDSRDLSEVGGQCGYRFPG
jgi:hypothetical protein